MYLSESLGVGFLGSFGLFGFLSGRRRVWVRSKKGTGYWRLLGFFGDLFFGTWKFIR